MADLRDGLLGPVMNSISRFETDFAGVLPQNDDVNSTFDTIVAPITAPGRAAVAALRVSGPDAYDVVRVVFPSLPVEPEPRKAMYGRFIHGDDGLILPFEAGASYTGEPTVELFIHGSPTSVRLLVDACLSAGARNAEPGEFTLRAFANGRLDLAQAEAVAEVVDSQTDAHLKAAAAQLAGALGTALAPALEALESTIVRLEASLDFSEEIGPLDYAVVGDAIRDAGRSVCDVRSWERPSLLVRDGLRVVILGRPNAGKSSLFNRLAGYDHAIVTDIPGTTRDVLEVVVDVRGIPVKFFDTAGIRENADPVEAIGICRAKTAAAQSHAVIYLYDCRYGMEEPDIAIVSRLNCPLVVAAKADLPHKPTNHLEVSAWNGEGLTELLGCLIASADQFELPFVLNTRHTACLTEAEAALNEAHAATKAEVAPDLILPALYQAAGQLRQILGLGVAPDVIDLIFAQFCIGK
ncbi:MAG: tRNA uridine-5-carboxymethylaminomethyl(34) synthesis GTPase MnmE [Fimbriimonadaceae bacterium]